MRLFCFFTVKPDAAIEITIISDIKTTGVGNSGMVGVGVDSGVDEAGVVLAVRLFVAV